MKTLIIFDDYENPMKYKIFDEDLTRFHGVIINSSINSQREKEFCDWMWNKEDGEELHTGWSNDVAVIESKEWDKVAICTFLP